MFKRELNIETEFLIWKTYSQYRELIPTARGTGPAGTHRHVEGWGLKLLWGNCDAHVMLLLWDGSAAVGWECCCLMELMLAVYKRKSSPKDSVPKPEKRVC